MTTPRCRKCGAFVSRGELGSIEYELDASLEHAEWVTAEDQATVAVLRRLAAALDAMRTATLFGDDTGGNPTYTAQVMLRYLSALLLTPEARGPVDNDEPADDIIATLRSIGTNAS